MHGADSGGGGVVTLPEFVNPWSVDINIRTLNLFLSFSI